MEGRKIGREEGGKERLKKGRKERKVRTERTYKWKIEARKEESKEKMGAR